MIARTAGALGVVATVVVIGASLLPACSSDRGAAATDADAGALASDAGASDSSVQDAAMSVADAAVGSALVAKKENPYGVAYPTAHIGTRTRTPASPGDVMQNFVFTGYAPGTQTISQVQLADVFDPRGFTHDVVALILNTRWDGPSLALMMNLQTGLPQRVAIVSVLGQGDGQGQNAVPTDLTAWHQKVYIPSLAYWLVPGFKELEPLPYDGQAVPETIILDARTMEIVSADAGYGGTSEKSVLDAARVDVLSHPPAY